MDRLTTAEIIKEVITIRDRCDALLVLLIPDEPGETECPHPIDAIRDDSSMGEEEYTCTRCGTTQHTPFHTTIGD